MRLLMMISLVFLPLFVQLVLANARALSEYEALLSIKSYIIEDPYNHFSSWNSTTHYCSWPGILCSSSTLNTKTSSVISLDISLLKLHGTLSPDISFLANLYSLNVGSNHHLWGPIPSSISLLYHLHHLDLSWNQFNGSLPSSLFSLNSLQYLDLSRNQFNSSLPSSLSSLKALTYLDLSWNQFNGSLPTSLFSLNSLQYLDLSWNQFSGSLPSSLSSLKALTYLDLSLNNFAGLLHSSLPSTLTFLGLSGNNLNGRLSSTHFVELPGLHHLELRGSNLSGEIPQSFSKLTNLIWLDLGSNRLQGVIPNFIADLPQLEYLDLSQNNFTGSIPQKFGSNGKLRGIYLGDNRLSGSIPEGLFGLPNLTYVELQNNILTGSFQIPGTRHHSVPLTIEFIVLSNNQLSGSLPPNIGNLSALSWLDLQGNRFSGSIPPTIGNLWSLWVLNLSGNRLYGSIPPEIGNLTHLNYVNFSRNQLSGNIPEIPAGPGPVFSEGGAIDMSYNLLQGVLPVFAPNIALFFASNNKLSGPIDLSICNSTNLSDLDLSNNNLTGQIPPCLGSSSIYLVVLNLRSNNLIGNMPANFSSCDNLMNLDLSYNRLEGAVTQSLANCSHLQVVNLGNNKLSDTFPHWLGSLSDLRVLVLHSNRFHGPMTSSSSFQSFSKLSILDVSKNQLNGTLSSKFISNMRAMRNVTKGEENSQQYLGDHNHEVFGYDFSITLTVKSSVLEISRILNTLMTIDVSCNMFVGNIPSSIGDLNALRWLNLSHNQFTNQIPPAIGNLPLLESLDLSGNNLSGEIPQEITKLTCLEAFNVSQNQLVGPIPESTQLGTFNSDSYLGNPGLCGPQLSNKCRNDEAPQHVPPTSVNPPDTEGSSYIHLWEVILIGSGLGWVIGAISGYLLLSAREPLWLSRLVCHVEYWLLQRKKMRARKIKRSEQQRIR